MATSVTETLLSADEFLALPDPPGAGKQELVNGKVVTHMPVGGTHGERQSIINWALQEFCRNAGAAATTVETGFILARNPDLVRAPDVALIRKSRLPNGKLPRAFVDGPPDLAIEVVSPSDSEGDVHHKVGEHLDAGVRRVWVVQEQTSTVVVYSRGQELRIVGIDGELTLDDLGFEEGEFSLPVAFIFE